MPRARAQNGVPRWVEELLIAHADRTKELERWQEDVRKWQLAMPQPEDFAKLQQWQDEIRKWQNSLHRLLGAVVVVSFLLGGLAGAILPEIARRLGSP